MSCRMYSLRVRSISTLLRNSVLFLIGWIFKSQHVISYEFVLISTCQIWYLDAKAAILISTVSISYMIVMAVYFSGVPVAVSLGRTPDQVTGAPLLQTPLPVSQGTNYHQYPYTLPTQGFPVQASRLPQFSHMAQMATFQAIARRELLRVWFSFYSFCTVCSGLS